jgi:hypothetical protein
MTAAAPRIHPVLIAALDRLDDPSLPIAETHRQLANLAEKLGFYRPSYQQVREYVHEARLRRRGKAPLAPVLVDVMFRVRPFEAIVQTLAGTDP